MNDCFQDEQDSLRAFLRELVAAGPPAAAPRPTPVPRQRYWSAADRQEICIRPASLLAARGELASVFGSVAELETRSRKPGAGWGRRKRFNSIVAGRPMMAASSLEFDVLRDLELDPTNLWYIEQPLKIKYDFDSTWRTATPDILVKRPSGFELIEVKYETQASLPDAERKWVALGQAFRTMGASYRLLTERHVRAEPRFSNVKTIFSCRHVPIDTTTLESLSHFRPNTQTFEAGELMNRLGISLEQVWALARKLHIAVDLDSTLLGPHTTLTMRIHKSQYSIIEARTY